jgi:hypothetical protein
MWGDGTQTMRAWVKEAGMFDFLSLSFVRDADDVRYAAPPSPRVCAERDTQVHLRLRLHQRQYGFHT